MKRLVFVIALSAFIATGCSSEPSAEEKRNLFDKCVLDYLEANQSPLNYLKEIYKEQAPMECKYLLD
jgi:uncharacterized protein YcfL